MTRLAACPTCTAPLRAGLRFCTQCGTALVPVTDARIAPPAPAPSVAPALHDLPDFDVAADFSTPSGAAAGTDRDADLGVDEAPAFEPVPALGPLAPAPAERPSILGLLAIPEPQPAHESPPAGEGALAAAPERPAVPASEPAPIPAASAPAPVEHPLGVPVISARRAPGPGADPTHIGRASAYGHRSTAVAAAGATLTEPPASADPAKAASHAPEPAPPEQAPATPSSSRAPRRYSPPPARSRAATWALITGILPLLVSIGGNLVTAELGRQAVIATEAGVTSGAWSSVFVSLSVVFVINAALLTVCAITGTRGVRETSNGITKGRALAVSGLAAGAVNLVLLVAGLAISISSLSAVLA